jgi:hypothetical protein
MGEGRYPKQAWLPVFALPKLKLATVFGEIT